MNILGKIFSVHASIIVTQIILLLSCESSQPPVHNRSSATLPAYTVKELRTKDWDAIMFPGYKIFNNVWGKDTLTNYAQEVFTFTSQKGDGFGWAWRWPITKRVVAYPEVMYGGNPWHPSRAKEFPRSLKDGPITVSYRCSMDVTRYCNFALEFWLHADRNVSKKNITHEVMIWQRNKGMRAAGKVYGMFTHNGVKYKVYINDTHNPGVGSDVSGWKYIAFVAQEDRLKDTLHIHRFVDYLAKGGLLKKDLYISGIEIGSEILGGEGTVLFHDFSVSVKK